MSCSFAVRAVFASAALLLSGPAFADHIDTAKSWVDAINPENNDYLSDATITWSGTEPIVYSKCGSFLGLVYTNAYAGLTTDVLEDLTGSISPYAADWYDSIGLGTSATTLDGTYTLSAIDGDQVGRGDILVTAYGATGTVDHAMLVEAVEAAPSGSKVGPTGTTTSLLVTIYDSSQTPHGPKLSPYDTRYKYPDVGSDRDKGIGRGQILLYLDTNGDILGWRWSVIDSVLNDQTDDGVNKYRPLRAGYITGPDVF